MEFDLTFLIGCCSKISPVQFIVQVLVKCHQLNVRSQDVHLCAGLSVPAVPLAAVQDILNKFSVGSVVPVPDKVDNSRIISKETFVDGDGWLVGEVCSVQGEQKRGQDCSLWGPQTACNCVQHTVPSPHILLPVCEVVEDPGREVHPCELQLVPQKCSVGPCTSQTKRKACSLSQKPNY